MFAFITRLLFGVAPAPSRTAPLGLDVFEDRVVPSSVTFNNGILFVSADQTTNDYVRITAAGASKDGSTGVTLFSSLNGWQKQTFGDATHPVTNIALDLKDGNDFVSVAPLSSVVVLVGEGNGNNFVQLGAAKDVGLIAGSGRNIALLGGGTDNGFGDNNVPNFSAGTVAFLGWGYRFANGGTGVYVSPGAPNNSNNLILVDTKAGQNSIVDINGGGDNLVAGGAGNNAVYIAGGGDNWVFEGNGNDRVTINGGGNNRVAVGHGTDAVNINGNGNNHVSARGSGSVTINGTGTNTVRARHSSNLSIDLEQAGAGSKIVASSTDGVVVNGAAVTQSGADGNVTVKIV